MKIDREKFNIRMIIWVSVIIIVLPLIVFLFANIFKKNPYGNELRIDNFSDIFPNAPEDTRDSVFAGLYGIVEKNMENSDSSLMPESGALIRDGSWSNQYDEEQNLHIGKFIVDIDSVKQSYSGYFKWSNDKNNPYFYGNYVGFNCISEQDKIYEDFVCIDQYSDSSVEKFPITKQLPITVEYYSENYSSYTKYFIGYVLIDDEKIVLKITDYTGGNYDNAISKIKELGFDPNDYEIRYSNISEEYTSVYVGDE